MSDQKIVNITLDERTVVRRSADVEHERAVAIFDLLEENEFAPKARFEGPFHLHLAVEENRLVLDVQDTVVFKKRIKNRWLFDALIFKNGRQLADFGRPGRPDRVIYHQWDPRYSPNQAPRDRMVLGYLGSVRSLPDGWQLPEEAEFVEFEDSEPDRVFQGAPRFNAHLAVRQPGRELLYKPNCKVSTAAACEAVLISTRDVTTMELLGEDYPFYCDLDPESVRATIERARSSFGSAEWEKALERLRAVRERTRFDRILDEYEDLFRELVSTS